MKRRLRSTIVILGLSACGFTPAANQAASKPPVQLSAVREGNYPIRNLPTAHTFVLQGPEGSQEKQGLVWLDNQRIMFVGIVRGDAASKGLYIWDIRPDTVSKYSNHTEFCYADGYIHAREFHIDRADQPVRPIRYGTLGQEKDDTCDVSTGRGCHGPLNMSCKPVEYPVGSSPLGEESVLGIQLRSGDGVFVTMTRRVSATRPESVEDRRERLRKPLLLLNKRYPSGKALSITAMEAIGARGTAYSSLAKRYVLVPSRLSDIQAGHSTNWPKGRPQPVYLVTPEGDVETIQVPSRSDWNTVQLSLPAVHGLVFLASGSHANKWGGLFLYDNGDVWRLDRGKAEALAISPDGCKAAYSIFNDFGRSKTNIARVKSIDFCKGDK